MKQARQFLVCSFQSHTQGRDQKKKRECGAKDTYEEDASKIEKKKEKKRKKKKRKQKKDKIEFEGFTLWNYLSFSWSNSSSAPRRKADRDKIKRGQKKRNGSRRTVHKLTGLGHKVSNGLFKVVNASTHVINFRKEESKRKRERERREKRVLKAEGKKTNEKQQHTSIDDGIRHCFES
jgi:hypothetical protein